MQAASIDHKFEKLKKEDRAPVLSPDSCITLRIFDVCGLLAFRPSPGSICPSGQVCPIAGV